RLARFEGPGRHPAGPGAVRRGMPWYELNAARTRHLDLLREGRSRRFGPDDAPRANCPQLHGAGAETGTETGTQLVLTEPRNWLFSCFVPRIAVRDHGMRRMRHVSS